MNPLDFIIPGWAKYAALAVIVALLFGTGFHYGGVGPTRALVEYKAAQKAAVREQEAQWAKDGAALAVNEFRRQEHRDAEFLSLQVRAARVTGPAIGLTRNTHRLLADASDSANRAGAPPVSDQPAAAVPATPVPPSDDTETVDFYDPADLAGAWISAASAYADVLSKLTICIDRYNLLRTP